MKKEKTPKVKHIEKALEKLLARRLFFLGSLMILFGSIMFTYAIFASTYSNDDLFETAEEEELSSGFFAALDFSFSTLTEKERQHSYVVAGIFAGIGTALIIISKRKKRGWNEEENSSC